MVDYLENYGRDSDGNYDNTFNSPFEHFELIMYDLEGTFLHESTPKADREYGLHVLTNLKEAKTSAVTRSSISKTMKSRINLECLMFNLNELLDFASQDFRKTENLDVLISHLSSITLLLESSLNL